MTHSFSLQQASLHTLAQLAALLKQLPPDHYQAPLAVLSGGTIGKHLRHILEFYGCLFKGLSEGCVDYDGRQRNVQLENDPAAALEALEDIIDLLRNAESDQPLLLVTRYAAVEVLTVPTTLYRELIYNLEHCIHHQATIRIGLQTLEQPVPLDETFGVAPSTMRYQRSLCAQ